MLLEALLFDFDGTLVDTAEVNWACYLKAFGDFGASLERERDFDTIFSHHWKDFVPAVLKMSHVAVEPQAIADRKTFYYAQEAAAVRVNQVLFQIIERFRRTMKIALVTTASRRNVMNILSAKNLERCFHVVVTGDDVSARKPSPEAYFKAAEMLGVTPEQCLAFEDSEAGIQSALASGAGVIRVDYASQQWL